MKKLTTAILITATAIGGASCKKDVTGHGPIVTETRNVQNYNGIDLRMNGNVYYTVGNEWKLEISAKQTIHSMLETTVIDNRLVIRYRNGKTYDADGSIRINVTAPAVSSLYLTTSGSIYGLNDLNTNELMLRSWGSGDIVLKNVMANHVDAETTVSGSIEIAGGNTISQKLKTKGSGKIDLWNLYSKTSIVHTMGSGHAKIKVSENLDARIDGSGSIYFSGYPFISSHISGSGRLVRM